MQFATPMLSERGPRWGLAGFDDLLRAARNYKTANGNWTAGEINYSGNVNSDDMLAQARNDNVNWPGGGKENGTFAPQLIV